VHGEAEEGQKSPKSPKRDSFAKRAASLVLTSDAHLKGKIPDDILDLYEAREWKHAAAILATDFATEFKDIMDVLRAFRIKRSHVAVGGGGKTDLAQDLDDQFTKRGWLEKSWDTKIVVDQTVKESPTHSVDC